VERAHAAFFLNKREPQQQPPRAWYIPNQTIEISSHVSQFGKMHGGRGIERAATVFSPASQGGREGMKQQQQPTHEIPIFYHFMLKQRSTREQAQRCCSPRLTPFSKVCVCVPWRADRRRERRKRTGTQPPRALLIFNPTKGICLYNSNTVSKLTALISPPRLLPASNGLTRAEANQKNGVI